MVSLALVSSSYTALSLDQTRQALDRAFPGIFLPENESSFVVDGEEPGEPRLIKSLAQDAKGIFLFHHKPGSFLNVAEDIKDDPRLRRLAGSDHGWMSIDLIKSITGEADALRFVTRALAQLAPSDAFLLVSPAGDGMEFDDKVRRELASGRDPFTEWASQ